MALLIQKFVDKYNYIVDDCSDYRSKDYFMCGSPLGTLLLLFLYYRFVRHWGPAFMEKRRPFELRNIMIIYNVIQIAISIYITFDTLTTVYTTGYYDIRCQPLNDHDTPLERKIVARVWLYFMVKITDLIDTVFFVLRKNSRQVTFLHLYHHMGMVLLGYIGVKYVPGGHGALLGPINCFVHAVMYTYYLLTLLSPEYRKNLWWKKHLTQLQIVQFLLLTIHFGHVLFNPNCHYPKWVSLCFLPQNVFMLYMFSMFYRKEYILKKKLE